MARRNIVTFDKSRPKYDACGSPDARPFEDEALFQLAQNLIALNARFAAVESTQTISINDVVTRLNIIITLLGATPPVDGPPIILTPAAINSDGTPQVGETLTGIDPVGNGPVVARRWIAGGTTVATTQAYAPTVAGSLRYEADLQGPDGTNATSGSTITVAAAPVAPTIFNTQGTSTLPASQVDGFIAPVNALDARFAALGV